MSYKQVIKLIIHILILLLLLKSGILSKLHSQKNNYDET